MIIYKVTNKINGKMYVGCTTKTLKARKRGHVSESRGRCCHAIHKAIKYYGENNFDWEVIDKALTQQEMFDKETYYIQFYDTYKNGYNSTLGADNTTLGYRFNDEQKEYFREIRAGKNNGNYNHKWSKEQKKNASITMKRIADEHKANGIINPAKRPEVREKIRNGKIGELNPHACKWCVTSPDETEYVFTGGLKRFLKEHHVNYSMMLRVINGKKSNHKGWKIRKVL